ncbi:CHAT domain-containing protein [Paracraurococcus ruber]|nr:CHAT domain-containing protein [Paracraurococcus ruber]
MITLRLTQLGQAAAGPVPIEIALEGAGPRRTAAVQARFDLPAADASRIRWYLEDYLERSADPAPRIAAGIERRMAEIGRDLFSAVFEANRDAIRLWGDVADRLGEARLEISTGIREAHALPWELLRDPRTDAPLALSAREFVRVQSQAGRAPLIPVAVEDGTVRLLVAICRPSGAEDVPFRSVASRLVKALTEAGASAVDLHVLRPPSFEELGRVLRRAKADGRPFHIVHFDGHGAFVGEAERAALEAQDGFDPRRLGPVETAQARGYVCFEDPARNSRMRLVDGAALGNLLYEAAVPVLVLNACRSAQGTAAAPPTAEAAAEADPPAPLAQEDQVRAYGSFAQAVVDAGVAGVVAMRYNVLVVTAAQFVGELYQTLAEGQTLGEAATRARKHLGDERLRRAAGKRIELQDWPVPAVYEAAPIRLFRRRAVAAMFDAIDWTPATAEADELPRAPDIGFIGRDETLLALDRGFDRRKAVLLHGLAGSGKTTTAAEFARWYAATGGLDGPLLFDSFEQYLPLPRLLDRIGRVFAPVLEPRGIVWVALGDAERRRLALQLLSIQPVLWIWDNVEQVAGFPAGAAAAWTAAEQQALADFLRDLGQTKAKVLLTSRREEAGWLGDLPVRVRIPPMPRLERMEFAGALLARQGGEARLVEALEPLLDFSRGNPLTLGVVLRQALREGIRTRDAAAALAGRLRDGEAAFEDDAEQGRSRSLGASLSYGFSQGFSEAERRRLALLHLFQGIAWDAMLAHVEALVDGGEAPEFSAWRELLGRAADGGLLTPHGQGLFAVHPALPWFFRDMFERFHPEAPELGEASPARRAERAFAVAVLTATSVLDDGDGRDEARTGLLRAQEANLLQVRRLAERRGWWEPAIQAARRLGNLYTDTGRREEYLRLLRPLCERLLDMATLAPRPGLEAHWLDGMGFAHSLALREYRTEDARRILDVLAARLRAEVGEPAAIDGGTLTDAQRELAHAYIYALRIEVGAIVDRREVAALPEAARRAEEAYDLACALGMDREAAGQALHLGHCYMDMARDHADKEQDYATAERWYNRALDKLGEGAGQTRVMCLYELAQLHYARFQNAMAIRAEPAVLEQRINDALTAARSTAALVMEGYPTIALQVQLLLGNIHDDAGMLTRQAEFFAAAGRHYQTAIQLADGTDDHLGASVACREMARSKAKQKEFPDALIYAEEAIRRAGRAGGGGAEAMSRSRQLLGAIRQMQDAAGRRDP